MDWNKIPNDDVINQTKEALITNGINVEIVNSGAEAEAKEKALQIIPEGSEVFNATSAILDKIGLSVEINNSPKYRSVRNELNKLNRKTDYIKMQKLGAAPEYILGSIHAVTQDGKVIVVSRTGSQLAAYVYGASHVIWVVSAKKIVRDLDEAFDRIYEHTLPLESERVKTAYGMSESEVAKKLVINHEVKQNRITMIIVKEDLGF